MTITREYGEYRLVCDVCGEQPEGAVTMTFESFEDARSFASNEGWKVRKDKAGNWENVCPGCH